jgi:hypothetical protein
MEKKTWVEQTTEDEAETNLCDANNINDLGANVNANTDVNTESKKDQQYCEKENDIDDFILPGIEKPREMKGEENDNWRKMGGELRKYSQGYKYGNDKDNGNGNNGNYNNGNNSNGYNNGNNGNNNVNNNYNNGNESINNEQMCNYGVKCNNYYCDKYHPPGRRYKCKFGDKCNKSDCKFLHPKTKTNECKFGINCTNENCKFEHPSRKIDWSQRPDRKDIVKIKILQFWERHTEMKPLNISLI